ncbi:MAG: hypothetical protein QM791_18075 [Ferruginibacter sp.]
MKLRAVILLLCLSVYHSDIVTVMDMFRQAIENKPSCNRQATSQQNKPVKKCSSEAEGDCTKTCAPCPLFYNAIISSPLAISLHFIELKKKFVHYDVNFNSEYSSRSWKPPDYSLSI